MTGENASKYWIKSFVLVEIRKGAATPHSSNSVSINANTDLASSVLDRPFPPPPHTHTTIGNLWLLNCLKDVRCQIIKKKSKFLPSLHCRLRNNYWFNFYFFFFIFIKQVIWLSQEIGSEIFMLVIKIYWFVTPGLSSLRETSQRPWQRFRVIILLKWRRIFFLILLSESPF